MLDKVFSFRNKDTLDEEELWSKFKDGDQWALSVLFKTYFDQLYLYGMNLFGNEGLVKDAIQMLFFRLWKNRDRIAIPESIPAYLFVSLRRILLRKKRREQARYTRNAEYLEYEIDQTFSIEEVLIMEEEREEQVELYQEALKSLTPRQREALLLRTNSGMKNREIAQIMDITDKRVRNLIYEAKKQLEKRIYELTG